MEFLRCKKVLIHPISPLSFFLSSGPGRRPSQTVIEQLKATNKSLKLGQRLCRSRSPDFLLEIIQRQVKFSSLVAKDNQCCFYLDTMPKKCSATATLHSITNVATLVQVTQSLSDFQDGKNLTSFFLFAFVFL